MKIFITGICGFAGSVLARALLVERPDCRIIGLDNLSRKGSETNVEPLKALGIDVRLGDVRNREILADLPEIDWVIDCSANPSVLAGVGDGSGTLDLVEQNLYGTVNLLEFCKARQAAFTLLSTSRVYSIAALAAIPLLEDRMRFTLPEDVTGSQCVLPPGLDRGGVTEAFSTAPPVSLYGSTKLCSELLALEYGAAFGFPVWINRCGVLAGAGQFGKADQGIFSYWIHSWRAGRPLRYIGFGGTGRQVRDCLHPRDLVSVLLKQKEASVGSNCPQILNLSGGLGNSMSLAELSAWCAIRWPERQEFYASLLKNDAPARDSVNSRPYDLPWLVLDSSQAEKCWDWRPSTNLGSILEEIADHADSNPNWLDAVI